MFVTILFKSFIFKMFCLQLAQLFRARGPLQAADGPSKRTQQSFHDCCVSFAAQPAAAPDNIYFGEFYFIRVEYYVLCVFIINVNLNEFYLFIFSGR